MQEYDLSVFSVIYKQKVWGNGESVSGPGSSLAATQSLRSGLAESLRRLNIRSLCDAPCGDMNWMKHLQYPFEKYIGIDLVPEIIDKLRKDNFPASYHFQVGNIVTDILPAADAVFCRDCLVHLPLGAIGEALRLWRRAGFRFAFVTTFPRHAGNLDCGAGDWRPLNMQAAPFNWPPPLFMIRDADGAGASDQDKSMGVWAL